jgi:anti-anti-sigma regulatory factor
VRDAFRDIAAAKAPVELDFAAVRHVDSAFLGQLHLLRSCARSAGFDLRLSNLPRPVRQVFRWSLCDDLLDPVPRAQRET